MRQNGKAILVLGALLMVGAVAPAAARDEAPSHGDRRSRAVIEFAEAEVFTEINATDGDAGFQLSVNGQDWRRLRLFGPDGREVFTVKGKGSLGTHGITGLSFESAEPPFDELALDKFKARFPEGTYRFFGRAIDGSILVGEAQFTNDFPDAPVITNPVREGVLDLSDPVIRWELVSPPGGSPIVHCEIIVSRDDPALGFSVELPPTAMNVTIPSEFLGPGEAFKVEVLAKEASGNQTITEVSFTTSA